MAGFRRSSGRRQFLKYLIDDTHMNVPLFVLQGAKAQIFQVNNQIQGHFVDVSLHVVAAVGAAGEAEVATRCARVHHSEQAPVVIAPKTQVIRPAIGIGPIRPTVHIGIAQPGDVQRGVVKGIGDAVPWKPIEYLKPLNVIPRSPIETCLSSAISPVKLW